MATNNILSFGTSSGSKEVETKPETNVALDACRAALEETLPKCFAFLNDLDDILFKLADKSVSNQEQEDYFTAMRLLRVSQDKLKKQFTQLVLTEFDSVYLGIAKKTQIVQDEDQQTLQELSLLDNESLEEDLAIDRIAIKINKQFGHDFNKLEQRLAHAINSKPISNNPVHPKMLCEQLKTVINSLELKLKIKIVAYKHFEQISVNEIGKLYELMNAALVKHNVLTDLEKNNPVAPKKMQRQPVETPVLDLPEDEQHPHQEQELNSTQFFEGLRQLLNKPSSGSNPQNQPQTGQLPVAKAASVVNALSGIQQMPSTQVSFDENGVAILPDVRKVLMDNLAVTSSDGSVSKQSISRLDEDAMDLIDLLFEFILDDPAIPAPIRATLARLQIPLLKISLNDKQIFSKKSHPARRLLNKLALASMGWSEHGDEQQDKLQHEIETIVNKIVDEFDTDIMLFVNLNEQFDEFMDRLAHSSQAAESRIVQTNEGKEKLINAQQQVDQVINEQLSQHQQLPKVVLSIIEDGWKHVLKLRLLQKGNDSEEWSTAVELMKQLIWSVNPKVEHEERTRLLELIPNMLKSLREGLSGASFNQHKISALFKELQQCHVKCMNGSNLTADELQKVEAKAITPVVKPALETLPSVAEEVKVIPDEEALEKAKNIAVGTWLEVKSDHDLPPKRIKFSWRSNLTGRCLFVTYMGTKAAEITTGELASWFQQGKATEIDQSTPLMDRALVSMMENVNINADLVE